MGEDARTRYHEYMHQNGCEWVPYRAAYPGEDHAVAGDVRVLSGVRGRGIARRDLLVWLPPGYDAETARRYPVLYLQDGQNVFDPATSFAGEWGADETALDLAAQGLEAILVAIPNGGRARAAEYSPWPIRTSSRRGQTLADDYLSFLLETVKPYVDSCFRTRRERRYTGIAGSSLGGLIALYAALMCPAVFGFCAALSPALWPGQGRIVEMARMRAVPDLRVYLDAGQREGGPGFIAGVRRLRAVLQERGCAVAYIEDPEGEHNEAAWRRRFPAALRWFLDPSLIPDQAELLPGRRTNEVSGQSVQD